MTKATIDRRGRELLNRVDRFVDTAREASSRGAAFIFAIIGIIAQLMHNGFLAYELVLIDNVYLRVTQAIIVAMAISFALMYFVLTGDDDEQSKTGKAINTFFILEVILNIFYYLRKIVFVKIQPQIAEGLSWQDINLHTIDWFDLPVALAFAFFIPYIIKSYAGSIQAHKPALAMDDDDFVKKTNINESIDIQKLFANPEMKEFLTNVIDTHVTAEVDKLCCIDSAEEHKVANYRSKIAECLLLVRKLQHSVKAYEDDKSEAAQYSGLAEQVTEYKTKLEEFIKTWSETPAAQSEIPSHILETVHHMKIAVEDTKQFKLKLEDLEKTSNPDAVKQIREEFGSYKQLIDKQLTQINSSVNTADLIKSGTTIVLKHGDRATEYIVQNK